MGKPIAVQERSKRNRIAIILALAGVRTVQSVRQIADKAFPQIADLKSRCLVVRNTLRPLRDAAFVSRIAEDQYISTPAGEKWAEQASGLTAPPAAEPEHVRIVRDLRAQIAKRDKVLAELLIMTAESKEAAR